MTTNFFRDDDAGYSQHCYAYHVFTQIEERTRPDLPHKDDALSREYGFIVPSPPVLSLPASHQVWDELAEQLPCWVNRGTQRRELAAIPVLSATADSLPDEYVCRAITLISHLAHGYYLGDYLNGEKPSQTLPDALENPWQELTQRLNRSMVGMTGFESVLYNWKYRDAALDNPLYLENLDLLIPFFANQEERIFNLSFLEIVIAGIPLVHLCLQAQDAVINDDSTGLERYLKKLIISTNNLTQALLKLDPVPHNPNYFDPIIWAKTAPNVSGSFRPSEAGLSGGSSPTIQLLDVFLGRAHYSTELGRQEIERRFYMPDGHIKFIEAINAVSVKDYISRSKNEQLIDLFNQLNDAFSGRKGFMGIHRRKIYTYMELGFKAGRLQTNAGQKRDVEIEPWVLVDEELEQGRVERRKELFNNVLLGKIEECKELNNGMSHINISLPAGAVYLPGDRCVLYVTNSDELVSKTLAALGADESSLLKISHEWRRYFEENNPELAAEIIFLRDFLKYAKIRPLDRETAEIFYHLTRNTKIKRIIDEHLEDQFELWDFLQLIADFYDPKKLWSVAPWQHENLSRILKPEPPHTYSISSSSDADDVYCSRNVSLTVQKLTYETDGARQKHKRHGAASSFLTNPENVGKQIRLSFEKPSFFEFFHSGYRRLFLFAGGTGVSGYMGLFQYLSRHPAKHTPLLFYGCRDYESLPYKDYLLSLVKKKQLIMYIAFSRIDESDLSQEKIKQLDLQNLHIVYRSYIDKAILNDEARKYLNERIHIDEDGSGDSYLYICGRSSFYQTVINSLEILLARDDLSGKVVVDNLIAQKRLESDVYSEHMSLHNNADNSVRYIPVSDVIRHNQPEQGYWMVIDDIVYDITDYINRHPGGDRILKANCGMDATRAYRNVEHHLWPEIESLLKCYQLGMIQPIPLDYELHVCLLDGKLECASEVDLYARWVKASYYLVEVQNIILNTYCIPYADSEINCKIVYDVHKLLFTEYLNVFLREHVQVLLSIVTAFYDKDTIISDVAHAINAVAAKVAVPPVSLNSIVSQSASFPEVIAKLITADHDFFHGAKNIMQQGLILIEHNQSGGQLLSLINQLLSLMGEYFAASQCR